MQSGLKYRFFLYGWVVSLLLPGIGAAQSVTKIGEVDSANIGKIMGVDYDNVGSIFGISVEGQALDNEAFTPGGNWFDTRDSSFYRTVKIGNQTWMVDNLTYDPGVGTVRWYNNDSATYAIYGRLYNATALFAGGRFSNTYPGTTQGACPVGWHVPSQLEWDTMYVRAEASYTSGTTCTTCGTLKDSTTTYWNSPNTGAADELGMEIRGAGYYNGSSYVNNKLHGYYWSSSYNLSNNNYYNYNRYYYNSDDVTIHGSNSGSIALSLRCIMNFVESEAGDDQVVASGTTTTLDADSVVVPLKGLWTIVEGIGGSITTDTLYNSQFSGSADSTYLLEWRVSFNGDTARDTVRITFSGNNEHWQPGDGWLDLRDNEVYATVQIGNQVWMQENLRYRNSSSDVFYNNDSTNYHEFGRLYYRTHLMNGDRLTLETPSGQRGLCPTGWHLPSVGEFDTLFTHIDGSHSTGTTCTTCGGHMKETGTEVWNSPNTAATNSTGFSAWGGGYYTGSSFSNLFAQTYFWTSSYNTSNTSFQVFYFLASNSDDANFSSTNSGTQRMYARCIKDVPEAFAGNNQLVTTDTFTLLAADSAVPPEVGSWSIASGNGGVFVDANDYGTKFTGRQDSSYLLVWTLIFATDTSRDTVLIEFTEANVNWQPGKGWLDKRDGQLYQTTEIGNQTWLAENLNYNTSTGSQSYYDNDSSTYAEDFGRLYNKTALMDGARTSNLAPSGVQGICPEGWHIPSTAEWDTLFLRINPSHTTRSACTTCGGPLKEEFTEYWAAPNSGATNSLGFNAKGSGYYTGSSFSSIFSYTYFWSSSYNTGNTAFQDVYFLRAANTQVAYTSTNSSSPRYSVRCVKNVPVSYAGTDQQITSGTTTALNADTVVVPEVGKWNLLYGTGANIADDTDPKTSFTGIRDSSYTLEWVVSFDGDTSRDTVVIEFIEANANWTAGRSWLDIRDGQLYETVEIGEQVWMAENLNYDVPSKTTDSYYNDDSTAYAERFGRLYNASTSLNGERTTLNAPSGVLGICPTSWHLPSIAEWDTLFKRIDPGHTDYTSCTSCGELKETTVLNWAPANTGATNSSGFSARGTGYHTGSSYSGVFSNTYFWTSSYNPSSTSHRAYYYLSYNNDDAIYTASTSSGIRQSVRCVKDEVEAFAGYDQLLPGKTTATLNADSVVVPYVGGWTVLSGASPSLADASDPESAFSGSSGQEYLLEWKVYFENDTARDTVLISFADTNANWIPGDDWLDSRDLQTYRTVKIGNQTWMAENLNYDVSSKTSDVYYNGDSATYAESFGRLYNRSTMMNSERVSNKVPSDITGVCPTGWHIPSLGEMDTLLTQVNSSHSASSSCTSCGGALKEKATLHWAAPNTSASNSTGFGMRGAGYYTGSAYSGVFNNAYLWTSSYNPSSTSNYAYHYWSYNSNSVIYTSSSSTGIRFSVRCIKNLPDADAGEDLFSSSTTVALAATRPITPHAGKWTVISGGGSLTDASSFSSSYTGSTGEHYLEWMEFFQSDTSRDTLRIALGGDGNNNWDPGESWLDNRDDEIYSTVEIGNQTWMSENLNYNSSTGTDSYYNSDSATYAADYGRLYNASASLEGERISNKVPSGVKGACPSGWHLPSIYEWDTLMTHINSSHSNLSSCTTCGDELKEEYTFHWTQPNTAANNSTGFGARGNGYYTGSSFASLYTIGYLWSVSYNPSSTNNRYHVYTSYNNDDVTYSSSSSGSVRYAIRCIKNGVESDAGPDILEQLATSATLDAVSPVAPHEGSWTVLSGIGGSVSNSSNAKSGFNGVPGNKYSLEWMVHYQGDTARDTIIVNLSSANVGWVVGEEWLDIRDFEQYGTVQIGTQIWMTENMRFNVGIGSQYYYNNDSASYHDKFGRLYNFTAMLDGGSATDAAPSSVRGVCPIGWHVPSGAEWDSLSHYLNASHSNGSTCTTCGGDMKEEFTFNWTQPNNSASNSTGFTGLGHGYRTSSGTFSNIYNYAYYWSVSNWPSSSNGRAYYLYYNNDDLTTQSHSKSAAMAVRCVKD